MLLACISITATAHAENPPPNWLDYSPPPECPSSDHIDARLVEWLGPRFSTQDLQAKADLNWVNQSWRVVVELNVGGVLGERTVAVNSCSEAADFIALAVALAVDSEFKHPLETSQERPTTLAEQPVSSATGDTAKLADPLGSALRPATDASEPSLGISSGSEGGEPWSTQRWFVSAELLGLSGILPRFALGGGVHVGLELGWLRFSGQAFVLPPVTRSVAGTDTEIWLGGGGVGICGSFGDRSVAAGPCLSGQWGSLMGKNSEKSGSGLFAAILPGAYVSVGTPRVRGVVRGDVLLPYAAPRFELSGGTLIYESRPGISLQLGVEVFLMD